MKRKISKREFPPSEGDNGELNTDITDSDIVQVISEDNHLYDNLSFYSPEPSSSTLSVPPSGTDIGTKNTGSGHTESE